MKKALKYPVRFFKDNIYRDSRRTTAFIIREFPHFAFFLNIYFKDKAYIFLHLFESNKNVMVKNVLIKRGKRNRIFLHVSAMSVLTFGVIVSPLISDSNFLSNDKNLLSFAEGVNEEESLSSEDVFQTEESIKPRDKIVEYSVQKGDTISTISKRFGVSEDTVRWANDLKNDNLSVGDAIKILPVTGTAHKVERGESVYSIAKKYATNPQEIVDFPFNDFADPQTFSLVEGQILIVPNGVKPEEKPARPVVRRQYIASGPVQQVPAGGVTWPLQGSISQFYSWYHKAIDIATPAGAAIVASHNGRVVEAYGSGWNWGYGSHVVIEGDGYTSLYAHMSAPNVSVGDNVYAGSTVLGWVGMTGRTTGPHLHFELRSGSVYLNPLAVLR